MTRYIAVILVLSSAISAMAQDSLDFETALLKTLSNNHLIKIASNDAEVAEKQAVMGRAGLLPTVNAEGSVNYGLNNTKIQVANSPDIIETTGAESNSIRASVNLNYTLFSGFANKYS
ncbi:TolC family protein, partial [bacterium]|nr:TolC family protein [bacterium]